MTLLELKTLIQDDIQNIIRENLENDPTKVALKVKEHGALIATQVKYLQRARTKLPSYYQAQCIIPSLAFEQCSSELCAATKQHVGDICIDLTCGLGVDSLYLAKGFREVISIEQDEILAEVAKHNFSLLGADNIKVINTSAENFINALCGDKRLPHGATIRSENRENRENREIGKSKGTGNRDISTSISKIDLIYVDPARRGTKGNKLFLLEECSPNVIDLMPKLLQLSNCVVIKASPLFDIDEAIKIFGPLNINMTVEVVSLDGECKELLIELRRQDKTGDNLPLNNTLEPLIKVTIAGRGSLIFRNGEIIRNNDTKTELLPATTPSKQLTQSTFLSSYTYLLIPDVTLYKARLTVQYITTQGAYITSPIGYGLSNSPTPNFWGKQHQIQEIIPYQPRKLKALFKQKGIKKAVILKKDFPQDADTISKALDIKLGGVTKIAFTRINNSPYAIILQNE